MLESEKCRESIYKNFEKLKEKHDFILIKNQNSETKKCNSCNKEVLKNRFLKGRRVCHDCKNEREKLKRKLLKLTL